MAITLLRPYQNLTTIVFIDGSLTDLQTILSNLDPSVTAIVLDPAQDGIQQMADALAGMSGLEAIHIISHGASGQLNLGTAQLTQDTLTQYQTQLATIGNALSDTGDLLLYGCNVAQGDVGQAFISALANVTGADVAASADLTGASFLGGNWVLEANTGSIEASSLNLGNEYQSTFATTVGSHLPDADATAAMAFLSWAAYRDYPLNRSLIDNLSGSGWEIVSTDDLRVTTDDPAHAFYEKGIWIGVEPMHIGAYVAKKGDTLAIVFRGTEEPLGLLTPEFQLIANLPELKAASDSQQQYFAKFYELMLNVFEYAKTSGLSNLYVTGHSLGGAMAEWFAVYDAPAYAQQGFDVSIATFGSPGTPSNLATNAFLSNVLQVGNTGDPVFNHDEAVTILTWFGIKHLGEPISVTLPNVQDNDPSLGSSHEHKTFLYERAMRAFGATEFANQYLASPGDHQLIIDTLVSAADEKPLNFSWYTNSLLIIGDSSVPGVVFLDNDTISGGFASDWLDGGIGDDSLSGGKGDDILRGGSGSDTLQGGSDDDALYGGTGNDTYVYRLGDGRDYIDEQGSGGQDTIKIYGGGQITSDAKFQYTRDAQGALWITIDDNNGYYLGRIAVANENQSASQVETLTIIGADGSTVLATYDLTTKGISGTPAPPATLPAVDHAPVISSLSHVLAPGDVVNVKNLFAASDPDGDNIQSYHFTHLGGSGHLMLSGVAVAPNTVITISDAALQAGNLTYQAGLSGSFESIAISASDGQKWSAEYYSFISSTANAGQIGGGTTNHAPIALDDAYTVTAGTVVTVPVLANDTDQDGDHLTIVGLEGNDPNLVSIASDGRSLIITTPVTMDWPFRFTYDISDGHGGSASANATITVNPSTANNHAPDGFQLNVVVPVGSDSVIDLSYHAKDPDLGDTFTVAWVGDPIHGTLAKNGSLVTYHPAAGYSGADTIDFSVTDNHGATNTLALALTVKAPLNAQDDFYVADYQQPVTFNPLANDTDDTSGMFADLYLVPQHGAIVANQDGTFTYTPEAGFFGTDRFQYLAKDPLGGSGYAWITIAVRDPNGSGGAINGGSGNDTLIGTSNGEIINGLGGDDVIAPGAGNDAVDGGDGFDTVDYSSSPAGVNATIQEPFTFPGGNGTVVWTTSNDGYGNADTLKNAEAIVGSALNDTLFGNSSYNVLQGGAGDDRLFASYRESFIGDRVNGGDGNDVVQNFVTNTTVTGGNGDDQILGNPPGSTNDVPHLAWGAANNWIDAGDGNDRVVLWGTSNTVFCGNGNDTISTGGYVDAGAGDDRVTQAEGYIGNPNYADDEWHLGSGNDYAVAGHGHDVVYGGSGDDTIVATHYTTVDSSADYYDGGDGADTLDYSDFGTYGLASHSFVVDFSAGTVVRPDGLIDVVANFENFQRFGGETESVMFIGNDAPNNVETGDGNDILQGGGGDDHLVSLRGADTFIGGAGADYIDPGDWEHPINHIDHIIYQSLNDAGDTISSNFQKGASGDIIEVAKLLSSLGYTGSTPFADGYLRLAATNQGTELQIDPDGKSLREGWITLATIQTNANYFTADNFDVGETPVAADRGGSMTGAAYDLGVIDGTLLSKSTWTDSGDTANLLTFNVAATGGLSFGFNAPQGSASIRLYDASEALHASSDLVAGGAGSFTINLNSGQYYLNIMPADSAVGSHVEWQVQSGLAGAGLAITGTSDSEAIQGTSLNDALTGLAGDDTLNGGAGSDIFAFTANGNGIDTVTDFSAGDSITVTGAAFSGAVAAGDGSAVLDNQIQLASSGGTTTLNIGTDSVAGADVQIQLTGTFSANSFSLNANQIILINTIPTGSTSIAGIPIQGQTLTATNTLADADGLGAISYQWQADGIAITGATSNTYLLTANEVGKAISVVASYTDLHGTAESVTSSATTAVANVNNTPTGSVTMPVAAKYFITDQHGNYIDWSAYLTGFSLQGKEVQLIGGAGDDALYVQGGTSADISNMGGGANTLYLTGSLADYTQTINQETGVYTFTRTSGLSVGQSEIVKFTVGDKNDVVYFADGHLTINAATDANLHDGTSFQTIQAGWLIAGGTPSSPVTTAATTATNPVKVFIVDAQGLDAPMLMQPGQAMEITGSGAVDTVYINAGTSVNAANLGGGNDRLYLTGSLSDYTQTINQETGVYTLSRSVEGQNEVARFTVGDQNDVVYFADGHITVNADPANNPGNNLHNGAAFQIIQAGWLTAGGAPSLINGDGAANVLSGSTAGDTLYGKGGADTINGGAGNDTIIITDIGTTASSSATILLASTAHGADTVIGFSAAPVANGGDVLDFSNIANLTDAVATGQTLTTDFNADNVFIFDNTPITIADAATAIANDASVLATDGYIVIADQANGNAVTAYHSTDLAGNGMETALVILSGVNINNLMAGNILT